MNKRLRARFRSQERRAKRIELWEGDPERYAKERFGIQLWSKQVDFLLALTVHLMVTVRSGHKIGKSNAAVIGGCWWGETRPKATVILTSTTDEQVKGILWEELRQLIQSADLPDATKREWPHVPLNPRTGFYLPLSGNKIFGRVARTAEGTAGFSGPNILAIGDEASGMAEPIFEALIGNTAGGGRLLLFGNPTQNSGTFDENFKPENRTVDKATGLPNTFEVSSWETPNAQSGKRLIPGLALREWCEERRRKWGEDDPRYQVRVLGKPAKDSPDNVITLGRVELAKQRWSEAPTLGEPSALNLGVDVARFGNDWSKIYGRRDKRAKRLGSVKGFGNVAVAGLVKECIEKTRAPGERVFVRVDTAGNGGGVADVLDAWNIDGLLGTLVTIVHENAARKPFNERKFVSRRDELWWHARRFFDEGGAAEINDTLEDDLLAPKYSYDSASRIRVESKDDIKKRLKRSPDDGDAFCLCVSTQIPMASDDDDEPEDDDDARWPDEDTRGF